MSTNPYDIYAPEHERRSMLQSVIESPVGFYGWLGTDLIAVPLLTRAKGLEAAMTPTAWKTFKNIADTRFGGSIRNLVLRGRAGDLTTVGTIAGSAEHRAILRSSRSMLEGEKQIAAGLSRSWGVRASGRIQLARGLHGLSRGLLGYMMFEFGMSMIRGINDLIENYAPPEPKSKLPFNRQVETGGGYVDTRSAQTQRQRAIQAIHNTQLSTRAALGNEASFLHMQHR